MPSLTTVFLVAGMNCAGADELPLERIQTIALKGPVGGMDHLAVDAKRGRLFVANTVNDSLDVVDLKAGRLLKQVPGQGRIRGIYPRTFRRYAWYSAPYSSSSVGSS